MAHGLAIQPWRKDSGMTAGCSDGQLYDASTRGHCILPDGSVMTSGVWTSRAPGAPVNYVVNWTTGGDDSAGKYRGYAAIHGWCDRGRRIPGALVTI